MTLTLSNYLDPETEAHYAFYHAFQEISTIPHCHDFYELFLVVNGRIQHIINNTTQKLTAGTLIFIRPDDVHYYRQDKNNDCQLINLSFAEKTMQDFLDYVGKGFEHTQFLDSLLPLSLILTMGQKKQVQLKLENLKQIPFNDKLKSRTNLRILLFELFTQYFLQEKSSLFEGAPAWFNKLCRQLQEPKNMMGGIETAHDLVNVTPEHMARMFKKYTDKTPTQYINNLRLNYSLNLLLYTDLSILEIALEISFDSLSHYYHLFKKQYGHPPAKVRKINQRSLIPK